MPALAPVMRKARPVWSGMSAVVHRAGMEVAPSLARCGFVETAFALSTERGFVKRLLRQHTVPDCYRCPLAAFPPL
jgi:hypothetical protein